MIRKIVASALAVLLLLTVLPVSALACDYKDIHRSWYTDAVIKYGYNSVFSAKHGKFNPNKKITRIEFVRLLHKSLGISISYFAAPNIADSFNDMKNTDVGAGELIDLVSAGIVDRGGSFNPKKQLDREMMVHWILNALVYKTNGTYPIPLVKPVPFKDDNKITDVYRSQVYSAVVLKLVSGRGHNKFHPKLGTTRAEAVTVVSRLIDLLGGANSPVSQSVSVTAAAQRKGDALVLSLTIKNNTDKAVTITHNSGQKYDFKLFDIAGGIICTWSADKSFMQLLNDTALSPGQSVSYTETVGNDVYTLINSLAVSMRAYIVGTSADFTIDPNGYPATIS